VNMISTGNDQRLVVLARSLQNQ